MPVCLVFKKYAGMPLENNTGTKDTFLKSYRYVVSEYVGMLHKKCTDI